MTTMIGIRNGHGLECMNNKIYYKNRIKCKSINYLTKYLEDNKLGNRGSTMIETLVSFVVLAIVFLALMKMSSFSSQLRMRAVDTANIRNSFNKEINKNLGAAIPYETSEITGHNMKDVKVDVYRGATDENESLANYSAFVLILDEKSAGEKTGTNMLYNFGSDVTMNGNLDRQVTLPYIDALGFKSNAAIISEEKLATPKVLRFMYHE